MRKRMKRIAGGLVVLFFTVAIGGCNGGGGGGSSPFSATAYTVGGAVTGLDAAESITLQDNSKDDLSVSGSGAFTFATSVTNGDGYAVTVATQPSGKLCTVASGSGTISANVTDVAVTCTSTAAVSGTVEDSDSGSMIASVTIVARDAEDHSMATTTTAADGTGSFTISVPSGQDFYLHADGGDIGGTTYTPSNLQIDNRTTDLTGAKFYLTDSALVSTVAGLIGGNTTVDAIFSWDVEDAGGGIAGVTATASSTDAVILYGQTDGTYITTAPTQLDTDGNSAGVIGYLPDPGGNSTVTFTQDPDQTTAGYTVDTSFKLRLIPGEISSPYESGS